jgi:hypothetical protein
MTQTIAKQINWDFETNGDLEIRDKNDKRIYFEDSSGYWAKSEYDSKCEGNLIYFENSIGYWSKYEYDSQGNQIYYEDSEGDVEDNRHKSSDNKVIEIDGVKYKLTKL